MVLSNLKNNTSTFGYALTAHSADGDTCPSDKDGFLPISDPLEDSISTNPELSANLGKNPKIQEEPLEEQKVISNKEILDLENKEILEILDLENKEILDLLDLENKGILDLEKKESIDLEKKESLEDGTDKEILDLEGVIKRKNKLNQFFLNMKILDFIKSVFLKEKNLSFLGFVTGLMVIFCFFLLIIFRILFKGS
jgi:hypothetical protein